MASKGGAGVNGKWLRRTLIGAGLAALLGLLGTIATIVWADIDEGSRFRAAAQQRVDTNAEWRASVNAQLQQLATRAERTASSQEAINAKLELLIAINREQARRGEP